MITLYKVMFYILLYVFYNKEFCNCQDNSNLLGIVVIYRHGDRAPFQTYKTDPYNNFTHYWPQGSAQLTKEGKMRLFQLGKWLRARYEDFLPLKYNSKDVYVRSTDTDRTLMSASANLAGLYPPTESELWNTDLNWQPIPIHTVDSKEDMIIGVPFCPKHRKLLDELLSAPQFQEYNSTLKNLYEYLTINCGQDFTVWKHVVNLHDVLLVEEEYNLTLPKWTEGVYPDKMEPIVFLRSAIFTYTAELTRLRIGPFFDEIINYFSTLSEKDGEKLRIYSAHGNTVVDLLNSMGAFEYHVLPYASTVIFELRRKKDGFFMNLLYKNSSTPLRLKVKGCDFDCDLMDFVELMSPIRVSASRWLEECSISGKDESISISVISLLVTAFIFLAVLLIFLYFTVKYCTVSKVSPFMTK